MITTRHLRLSRRTIDHLMAYGGSYIVRRKITQRIRDATYAFYDGSDDGSGFWWHAADGKKLTRVQPHLCDIGDLFVVCYRGQPSADSKLTLEVLHVSVSRFYDAEGFHGDTARMRQPKFWRGERMIDNPWAWIVTCNIIRKIGGLAA